MYAVIASGGKQYRVAIGDRLRVEKLNVAEGDDISLHDVLMMSKDGGVKLGSPKLNGVDVSARVLKHGRGEKIRVFKMKRRKGYHRTQGHRQDYTELEIMAIAGDSTRPAGAKSVKEAAVKAEASADDHDHGPDGVGDNLTTISGIGPVIEEKLHAMNITTFAQIAVLTAGEIAEINEKLSFEGRIEREEWVEQAKALIEQD